MADPSLRPGGAGMRVAGSGSLGIVGHRRNRPGRDEEVDPRTRNLDDRAKGLLVLAWRDGAEILHR